MLDKNGIEIKTGDIVRITGAYFKTDNAVAAYRSEMNHNKNPNVKYRIVSAHDTTRKDTYVPVFGFKSAACTL